MDVVSLVHKIACSVCRGIGKPCVELPPVVVPPKPIIELLSMPYTQVDEEIKALGLTKLYPTLLDYGQPYYYTKAEDWAEVFHYIYFVFPMPDYLMARFDCEDFAILLKGLVASLFGLNYFGVVLGKIPQGYHGWNIFRTEVEVWQLEPQTGLFFPMWEKDYKPEKILI